MDHHKFSSAPALARSARVFIVDDHPTVRRGMKTLVGLEADLVICGEAEGVVEAWKKISTLQPEVVVVDLTLQDGDGLDLIRRLRKAAPDLVILAFTMHNEAGYLARALKAGADDVVLKDQGAEKVITTIRSLQQAKLDGAAMPRVTHVTEPPAAGFQRLALLTGRLSQPEMQVLYLMGREANSLQIARRLHLSPRTVERHAARIQRKLGLNDQPALARYARRLARVGGVN